MVTGSPSVAGGESVPATAVGVTPGSDATASKERAKLFQRTIHAHARRVLAQSKAPAQFRERASFEEAREEVWQEKQGKRP